MNAQELKETADAAVAGHTTACLEAEVGQCAADVALLALYADGYTRNPAGIALARKVAALWRAAEREHALRGLTRVLGHYCVANTEEPTCQALASMSEEE